MLRHIFRLHTLQIVKSKPIVNLYICNTTTPIMAMGCLQCLPLSVVQLKGKHWRKPHCRNGVVDMFELYFWRYKYLQCAYMPTYLCIYSKVKTKDVPERIVLQRERGYLFCTSYPALSPFFGKGIDQRGQAVYHRWL